MASPTFTHVYAALVAVLNTKMPENGELIVKRIVVAFRRAFKRNDKIVAVGLAKFIAHLVNYQVANELLALQLLTLLLSQPTDDSVEVAVNFVKECGQFLMEVSSVVRDCLKSIIDARALLMSRRVCACLCMMAVCSRECVR